MSSITATGVAAVADLKHGVSDGAPYADVADGETLYVFETGTTRLVVTGSPDGLRQFAGEIVQQVDAHEKQQKRETH